MLNKILKNLPNYSLLLIALISALGGLVYKIYSLNIFGVILTLVLTIISFILLLSFENRNKKPEDSKNSSVEKISLSTYLLIAAYSILLFAAFYILFSCQTDKSIISPWQVVPSYFFIIYFLLITLVIFIIQKKTIQQFNNLTIFLLIPFYFLSFSIALIVYKIGFGFDPFIHEATINLIDKNGLVTPKPFYYLGWYSLVVIFHKLTFLPVVLINKFLVPVLASVFIPLTLTKVFDQWFNNKHAYLLTILFALALPFSIFILSTPQNLAFLFLILIILLGLICKSVYDLIVISLLALAALLTQPIAGIPAVFFTALIAIYHSENEKIKKYYYTGIFIASSIALPLAFYIFNSTNLESNQQTDVNIFSSLLPKLSFPSLDDFILNFVYLYGFNLKFIIGTLFIVGFFLAWKHRQKCKIFSLYFLMFASSIASYFLTKFNSFSFLIDYERENYLERILIVSVIFLTPFIILTFYSFALKILKQSNFIKYSLLIFTSVIISASLYYSYPRFDNYFNSHGYSVSATDIEAVRFINESTNDDYIVLANQQVSVAALREFGFKKYYKDDIFYYPIPTGAPLYSYYLDMVYDKPSRETMHKAMELAGVNKGYFVLNKYWWAFPKILDEAKLEADNYKNFNNGEVWVFEYLK